MMYDIRGRYPLEINESIFRSVGLKSGSINSAVVGFDSRMSSNSLFSALVGGLIDSGVKVKSVGCVPFGICMFNGLKDNTESFYITASHNQPEFNGLKVYSPEGISDIQFLKELNNKKECLSKDGILNKDIFAVSDYISFLKSRVSITSDISLLIDCMYGTAGLVIKPFLKEFGIHAKLIRSGVKPDFNGITPTPSRENNALLIEKLRTGNYDFGVAFDGDCDRLQFFLNDGRILRADFLGFLFSKYLYNNAGIVRTVDTSEFVKVNGASVVPVGRPNIESALFDNHLTFGFERSSHFYFNDVYPFSDGFLALLKFILLLEKVNVNSFKFPRFYTFEDVVQYKDSKFKQDTRVVKKDYWFIIRKSNTEPVVRIIIEAKDKLVLERLRGKLVGY